MKRIRPIDVVLFGLVAFGFSLRMPKDASAETITEVSITQSNFGPSSAFQRALGPAPVSWAAIDSESDPDPARDSGFGFTKYQLEATSDVSDFITLKTTARLDVFAEPGDIPNNWNTVDVFARASSTLNEIARVQGVPDAANGVIEFFWNVSGDTRLSLVDAHDVSLQSFAASTLFEIPGLGVPPLLEQTHTAPSGAEPFEMSIPASSTGLSFQVPWQAGQDVPVTARLSSRVELSAESQAAFSGRIDAEGAAEFGNSAWLDGIIIRDASGGILSDASLVSMDGSFTFPILQPLPEPSSGMLALWGLLLLRPRSRRD